MPTETPETSQQYHGRFEGARALITGGAGFIGSHIARRLLDLGASVTILDDLRTGHEHNIPADAMHVNASILDSEALAAAIQGCDYVFHKAAMVSVPLSVEAPRECHAVNVDGTVAILEAARDAGVMRVMFASSAAVYGADPVIPSREDHPIECVSPYAASKAAGEGFMAAWARCYDVSTVNLRYFNVFGPRQDPKSAYAAAISAFVDAVRNDRKPTIFGDGQQTRDFVPIANVVHANLLAASHETRLEGQCFNIATGERISLLEVLASIGRVLGKDVTFDFGPERAGDVRHSGADISRARSVLGYEPLLDFDAGLARLLQSEGMLV